MSKNIYRLTTCMYEEVCFEKGDQQMQGVVADVVSIEIGTPGDDGYPIEWLNCAIFKEPTRVNISCGHPCF